MAALFERHRALYSEKMLILWATELGPKLSFSMCMPCV